MWGDAFLVAPVLNPGVKELSVYLPEGDWYNYWTNEKLAGGSFHTQALTMNEIPVYAKAGSFVTSTERMQNTEAYTSENLTVSYYLSSESSTGKVYFDDGKTKEAITNEAFQVLTIEGTPTETSIEFSMTIAGNGYTGAPENRNITLSIVGMESTPKTVSVNGESSMFQWQEGILSVPTKLSDSISIQVEL